MVSVSQRLVHTALRYVVWIFTAGMTLISVSFGMERNFGKGLQRVLGVCKDEYRYVRKNLLQKKMAQASKDSERFCRKGNGLGGRLNNKFEWKLGMWTAEVVG